MVTIIIWIIAVNSIRFFKAATYLLFKTDFILFSHELHFAENILPDFGQEFRTPVLFNIND